MYVLYISIKEILSSVLYEFVTYLVLEGRGLMGGEEGEGGAAAALQRTVGQHVRNADRLTDQHVRNADRLTD